LFRTYNTYYTFGEKSRIFTNFIKDMNARSNYGLKAYFVIIYRFASDEEIVFLSIFGLCITIRKVIDSVSQLQTTIMYIHMCTLL